MQKDFFIGKGATEDFCAEWVPVTVNLEEPVDDDILLTLAASVLGNIYFAVFRSDIFLN